MTRPFFDTNILLYLVGGDPRAAAAERVVGAGGAISVQVLNEFVSVARRKHALSWDECEEWLAGFRTRLHVEPLSVETHVRATELARRHRIDIYDATILAAAEQAECTTLYTEDLHAGAQLGRIDIVNPFLGG